MPEIHFHFHIHLTIQNYGGNIAGGQQWGNDSRNGFARGGEYHENGNNYRSNNRSGRGRGNGGNRNPG